MIWIGILFTIIALILVIFEAWNSVENNNSSGGFISGLLCAICITIATFIFINEYSPKQPTAIDVYNGKTTLEITYKDSIPVDSVVVFKEEFK